MFTMPIAHTNVAGAFDTAFGNAARSECRAAAAAGWIGARKVGPLHRLARRCRALLALLAAR